MLMATSGSWGWELNPYIAALQAQNIELGFVEWVKGKYSKTYSKLIINYTKKYSHLIKEGSNLRELESFSDFKKPNVIKSLLILAKYNGCYSQFKERLKSNGIKSAKPNSLNAFLRILNASDSNILGYYRDIQPILRPNERLYSKFLLLVD